MLVTGERYCSQLKEEGGRSRLLALAENPMVDEHVRVLSLKIIDLLENTKS